MTNNVQVLVKLLRMKQAYAEKDATVAQLRSLNKVITVYKKYNSKTF